ncbi:MAG: hypothetical protein E6H78_18795, partial [Betaproteobacteria bacterium]
YVVARLPHDMAALAAARDYLPRSVPILKQIAAINGQRVCIRNPLICIDGAAVARALLRWHRYRPPSGLRCTRWSPDWRLPYVPMWPAPGTRYAPCLAMYN